MRIKQLELTGFKSFPQRTVLDIPKGVTGVVGPNGCGKSNVVDAIRWVLGEQSAKHLRGVDMESVVFNGNERVAPLGMAEVSITFDTEGNSRPAEDIDLEVSSLPAHFRDLAEIRITRRFFRSGESEYLINKIPCRLKDITELFLGTGIGSKAYAIIEQGRVEELVKAKPEDRRLFIEEAAGTTLYRSRKLAAERKMEHTRENLARLNDVLHEIDRQVHSLQRQAKKAQDYRRYQEQLRELELNLAGAQWRRLQRRHEELDAAWQAVSGEEQQLRGALDQSMEENHAAVEAVAAAERGQAERREALAVLDAERQSVRERMQMLVQECQERERRHQRLTSDLEGARAILRRLEEERSRAEREREESARSLVEGEGELSTRETALGEARATVAEAQAALDAAKGCLVEHLTREVEVRNALTAGERRRDDIARQLGKLRGEEEGLTNRLAEIDAQLAAGRSDLGALREQLSAMTGEKESRAEQLRLLEERRRRLDREATELEGVLVQVKSRLESIEQIQRNYEGFNRSVRAIMRQEQHPDGVIGVVADVIDIPEPYERAVAAALGDRLQYMIVRGEEDGIGAVGLLREQSSGRGSFIPLQPRLLGNDDAAKVNGTSRRLLDLVKVAEQYQPIVESLLGEVVLVEDLETAVALYRKNGVHVTFVTREGDIVDPSGVITGGSDHPIEEEILARRREIEVLRRAAAETSEQLLAVRGEAGGLAEQVTASEQALRELGEGVHELTVRIVSVEKDLERLDFERPQCLSRREVVRYEIGSLTEEDRAAEEEHGALRERQSGLSGERLGAEEMVARRKAEAEASVGVAESLNAELTATKVRVAERRQTQQAAAARAEALGRQLAETAARQNALAADLEATDAERAELERSIGSAKETETTQTERRGVLVAEVEAAGADVTRCGEALRAVEQRARETQVALEEKRAARGDIELARSETRLRSEHVVQTMHEKYAADLAAHAAETAEWVEPEDGAERLDTLRARIGKLGDVNVGAIDELREFEERGSVLRAQRDDLERSLADLERTIQKLNRVSKARFAETFARANEMFQKVFPRLFRGGEARLVLTDENNLLESGVDIYVRPPGKRLETVALLSGGEKALVAVSLIFSLFLINPTPFCVLDEVDAPLDDSNIGRFSQMIREMSDRLQFLVITHNKRTMESADVLYGVTMQEPGISKVISVNMS